MTLPARILSHLLEDEGAPAEKVDTAYAALRQNYAAYTHASDEDLDTDLAQALQQAIAQDLKWSDLQLIHGGRAIICENDENNGHFMVGLELSGEVALSSLSALSYLEDLVIKAAGTDAIHVDGTMSYAQVKTVLKLH